jgi:hypothetical protein
MLYAPDTDHYKTQTNRHHKLNTNPQLLKQYEALKESCQGLPLSEYEKRKLQFFKL